MRSRTWREGSVGLFIIMGIALFGSLAAWLQGLRLNRNSYTVTITFDNSNGMVVGGAVRYRGVKVGNITEIIPTSNGIDAQVSISPATLKIPRQIIIEANQAGLISETAIDLNPEIALVNQEELAPPLSRTCDRTQILCDGDTLQGQTGISINTAMRSTMALSDRFTDEEFFGNIVALTANASSTAQEVGELSKELTLLSKAVRGEVKSVSRTANTITAVTNTSARQLNNTAGQINSTAGQINSTAEAYRQTALELNQLTRNLNTLVVENQANISDTLASIRNTSNQLSGLVLENQANISGTLASIRNTSTQLSGLIVTFGQTLDTKQIEQLLTNFETLSTNATVASENLKTASEALGDPTTIVTLQQTLQAARATFENVQKITADLDELTGNPSFRHNVQDLIEGLNDLVSSTDTLEQQIYLAQHLPTVVQSITPIEAATEGTEAEIVTVPEVVHESIVIEESVQPNTPTYEEVQDLFTHQVELEQVKPDDPEIDE